MILKNSIFLFFRMLITIAISLYSSRIIINSLGISDYGLYTVIGGVVGLFAFFNSAMTSALQRFLSFEIGKGNFVKLNKVFNIGIIIHIGIAILVFVLAETIGYWFVNNKLIISSINNQVVNFVFQLSIFTTLITIIQVPFLSLIISREKMGVFAFINIVESILKLTIVILLLYLPYNKLYSYCVLLFIVTLLISLFYIVYCFRVFPESKLKLYRDFNLYKELVFYSGWNLFGNIAGVARSQGINVLLNLNFGTSVNASYGIMMQVQNTFNLFVNNFQMAVNPQIIMSYAQENYKRFQFLVFLSSRISFYLTFVLVSPILFNVDFVLRIWLKIIPNYASEFVQLCMVFVLIECISGPLMKAVQASGKIKWYQIILGSFIFLCLPISYILFIYIPNPVIFLYVLIGISFLSLAFRIWYLDLVFQFPFWYFLKDVVLKILLVFICCTGLHIAFLNEAKSFMELFLSTGIITLINLIAIWFIGLNKAEKKYLKQLFHERIFKKNSI